MRRVSARTIEIKGDRQTAPGTPGSGTSATSAESRAAHEPVHGNDGADARRVRELATASVRVATEQLLE